MEAATAYYEATGKDRFLNLMCRYADLIIDLFGRNAGQIPGYPGHQEIELALVKLFHVSGERKYLELSRYFINERGREPNYFRTELERLTGHTMLPEHRGMEYFQAHKPVREQDEAVGHAVRALYLYSGMADIAREYSDGDLLRACKKLWSNVVDQKMYVTGAVGSCHQGETFTDAYDLPNEEAYAETCASIALIFFAWRMFGIEKDARYIDVLERALYNGASSGTSLDGERFFYVNPLACSPEGTLANGEKHQPRSEWFTCSCCPPNVARLRASLGQYFYEVDGDNLWVNLYNDSCGDFEFNGTSVQLTQKTDYPWDGGITIELSPEQPVAFTLVLRLPDWCSSATLLVNGETTDYAPLLAKGYIRLSRTWKLGDTVELALDMPVRKLYAHPQVRHDNGRVALQRGPIVYCIEEVDNGPALNNVSLAPDAEFAIAREEGLLGGVVSLSAEAKRIDPSRWDGRLYSATAPEYVSCRIKAVPYYAWGNREFGEMLMWIREGETTIRDQK
jgi:DUF1680 family protein